MIKPCLLIPVYNHGSLIEATWETLRPLNLPCLLVDDGSDAATAHVLDALAAREPLVTLLRLPQNAGKGVAVLHGIAQAAQSGFTHAVQIDADGQHDARDIPAMLAIAEREPQALVSGWPQYGDDMPSARRYGRWVTHVWVWIETLSTDIKDSMCGFRVYPVRETHALAQRTRIGSRMNFDTDIMVRLYWAGTPVRFVKTRVRYPENGISHFDVWRDNVRISWMHTKLCLGMLLRLPVLLARKCRKTPAQAHHWSEQEERGSYLGMRFSIACYRLFGRRAMNALLVLIVSYFFLTNRPARQASRQYLQRLAEPGYEPTLWHSFRHFLAFGESIVDRLAVWSGDIQRSDTDFRSRETLLAQARSGRGGILLTSHLGAVDICRGIADETSIKLNVLVFDRNARQINRALQHANPRSTLELIPIDRIGPDTAILLSEKIARGEFVAIAADRTSPASAHRVSQVPFLGFPAPFPQGPFILAALLECPVYLLFALKHGKQYRISLEPFADILPLPRRERAVLLERYAARYAERLAAHCRRTPYQWFNFHDVWQDSVPDTTTGSRTGATNNQTGS
ncbi:MAG: glycosyltransferase family 2 protein [Gammaproteobacteria bacterium]|nr:MAG: glycosyltransferase family 2 protein [Gammaproteobacteria bacterium]